MTAVAAAQLRDADTDAADTVPLRRIAGLFAPYRWAVFALLALAGAQALANVASPFLLREIIDRALPERSAALVDWFAGGVLVAAMAAAGLGVATTWLSNLIGQRVMHDLREQSGGSGEEVEHPLGEQLCGYRVVGRQRCVGEQVRRTRVEEQLGILDLIDEGPRRVDVALVDEERVGVHRVDLCRHAVRPGAEHRRRHARVEQQRAARAGPGLGEPLRRDDAQREACVHDIGRQGPDRLHTAHGDLVEADLFDEGHAVVDALEGASFEQVRGVHGVAGGPQRVGEPGDAGRQTLHVVEQHDCGHAVALQPRQALLARGRP
jgi:hypothetical protein